METEHAAPANGKLRTPHVYATYAERYRYGESLRDRCSRASHGEWKPSKGRPDPLALMKHANEGRIPELVPLRHGRMLVSPFTFYRGAALNMAADLASTPSTGMKVQACGDAHLMNFGGFATPERQINFDINDLDETLAAPWEWDIKRLAASVVLACRDNALGKTAAEEAVLSCVRAYREHLAEFGVMRVLDVWYARLDPKHFVSEIEGRKLRKRVAARLDRRITKAMGRSALEYDFPKLAKAVGEESVIQDSPPTIYHLRDQNGEIKENLRQAFMGYRASLREDRRVLLDRFEIKDAAIMVVGVGSVGTMCSVVLMMAGERDPLFLQVKEARASVLEAYAGKSTYANHGQRVIVGHHLIQSASDVFLGWAEGSNGRHFYVRQLRDAKIKPLVEEFGRREMLTYGTFCGESLARAHARSGDAAAISGYLGESDRFDVAIAKFAMAYADQSERDYDVLTRAARAGQLEVQMERE